MDYPKEIIKKIYRNLPDELRAIVATPETAIINDTLAKENKLNREKRLALGDEITMRLLGVTTKDNFKESLKHRLQINDEVVEIILGAINSNMLSKIPEKTLKAQEEYAQEKLKTISLGPKEEIPTETPDLESLPPTKSSELEIPPANLPMIEPGETAHDPKPFTFSERTESVAKTATPNPQAKPVLGYSGKDPYREPLE